MQGQLFHCSLGRRHRRLTFFLIGFLAVVFLPIAIMLILAVATAGMGQPLPMSVPILFIAITIIIPGVLYALARYAPKACRIDQDGISVVRRNGKRILIPAQDILSIEPISRDCFRGSIRTCGVGGFFGSWGWFSSPELNDFRAYVTNESLVFVRTAHQGPFVLSPDARDEFIASAIKTFNLTPTPRGSE